MGRSSGELERWCAANGWRAASPVRLAGGQISTVVRLRHDDGSTAISKTIDRCPAGLFAAEARGLRQLGDTGLVTVPQVLAVGEDFLIMSDLGTNEPDRIDWAALGRGVAALHALTSPRFGADDDNFLGRLPQINTWTDDGHEFFAEHRLLRYLGEPPAAAALTPADRTRLERLAGRLSELVPVQPAALLHGDLWHGNIIGTATSAALLDPACYSGWPEAELSMLWCCGQVPPAFFAAYTEVHPLETGWQGRMELLHLREHLSTVAHFGDHGSAVAQIRDTVRRYLD